MPIAARRVFDTAPRRSAISGHHCDTVDSGAVERDPRHYLNRELSWLDFNARVRSMAAESSRPLLERVKFLAICSQNLDEFFQVRVADLQDRMRSEPRWTPPDGRTAEEQLEAIRKVVARHLDDCADIYRAQLLPALAEEGIEILTRDTLLPRDLAHARALFDETVRPVLIPLSVDASHPFPYVSALSLSVGAIVSRRGSAPDRFARIKVPPFLPRLIELSEGRFVLVEEMILGISSVFNWGTSSR